MTLPELAIRRPVTTLMMLICILVLGVIALVRLPLAFMPDQQENNIFVIVNYPNASPKAIERMILKPLEEHLASLNGLSHMWSRADSNSGRVNLIFEIGTDIELLRADIRERIDRAQADLPEDVDRILLSYSWNPRVSGESILEARLSSDLDLSKNYELLDRKIIKPLERIPGVAAVTLDGVNPREIKVDLKLDAMKRHRVDASMITRVLRENNVDRSLGVLRNDQYKYTLRTVGSFREVAEIQNLPLPSTSLRLRDVADVTYTEPPLEYGRHLEGKFAVGVSVTKESSANTVEVNRMVHERVAKMTDDPDLEGIKFLVWEDQGEEIVSTINDLKQTGLLGAILSAVILFLFLRRLTTTSIALTCIPFSLVVACGIVWAQGKSMNTITLLGLIVGIGMLVDNAVVIMENIDRYQRKGYGRRVAALLGAREVSVAVTAATLTSIIVFLPLLFNKPTQQNIILRELAITIIFTLAASLFVSQTLIPLASAKLASKKSKPQETGPIMSFLQKHYATVLGFTLRHRLVVLLLGVAVVASAYVPFKKIDFNLETNESEMFVGMRYVFSESLSLDEKEKYVNMVEAELIPLKDQFNVDSVYSFWSEGWTLTRLYMKDGYTSEEHMAHIRKALPDVLPKIAGVRIEVQDGSRPWERNRGKKVAYQLKGPDTEVLARLSQEAVSLIEQEVPGMFDVYTTAEGGSLELHAIVDRDRARNYGVDLSQPGEVVELTFRGRRLDRFKGPDGEVEMRLTMEEQENESISQLKNLPVRREGTGPMALDNFASFSEMRGPDQISRNNRVTGVWVGGKYEDGKKEVYMEAVKEAISKVDLPYGYSWDMGNYRQQRAENMEEMWINVIFALFLVFAVMAGLFESVWQAFGMIPSIFFAVAGALWALFLMGAGFDQPAFVGLILLAGIVVNNGIVMIEHINTYRRRGMDRNQAMLQGATERLRPILMTALTTLMGLVPMAVQKPSLGGVYYYSMAYVLMGGLLVSTVLTMVLLPGVVTLVEDVLNWVTKPFGLRQEKNDGLVEQKTVVGTHA